MSKQIIHNLVTFSAFIALVLGLSPAETLADGFKCVTGTSVEVCVEWSRVADPIEGIHFEVTFSDALNPDIELITADQGWIVSAELVSTGAEANIGDLTIDPNGDEDDFEVTILNLNGSDPGAANLGSAVLDPPGDNHSSISGHISGDLTGDLTVVADSGGTGGEIGSLTVGGDMSGDIDAAVVSGGIWIGGDLSGTIDVLVKLDSATLSVSEEVTSTGRVKIDDVTATSTLSFGTASSAYDFAGRLTFGDDVPSGVSLSIHDELTNTGSIDLENHAWDGTLTIYGGGAGQIINGGALGGTVTLASGSSNTFSGAATFSSLESSGYILLIVSADLSGTVTITGDADSMVFAQGDLLSSGEISVGGDLSGRLVVGDHVYGDLKVAGDVTTYGSIEALLTLKSTGRILVDGLCDGAIRVGTDSESLSLIRITEGLDVNGEVVINAYDDGDANGNIHIGGISADPLPAVTFDGMITINQRPSGGGALNGTITVVGCHATAADLDICIEDDSGTGSVVIDQSGCRNQVDWSCP